MHAAAPTPLHPTPSPPHPTHTHTPPKLHAPAQSQQLQAYLCLSLLRTCASATKSAISLGLLKQLGFSRLTATSDSDGASPYASAFSSHSVCAVTLWRLMSDSRSLATCTVANWPCRTRLAGSSAGFSRGSQGWSMGAVCRTACLCSQGNRPTIDTERQSVSKQKRVRRHTRVRIGVLMFARHALHSARLCATSITDAV
jgi:hypothetical protein